MGSAVLAAPKQAVDWSSVVEATNRQVRLRGRQKDWGVGRTAGVLEGEPLEIGSRVASMIHFREGKNGGGGGGINKSSVSGIRGEPLPRASGLPRAGAVAEDEAFHPEAPTPGVEGQIFFSFPGRG